MAGTNIADIPADTSWDGTSTLTKPGDPALNMAQSANGSMVLTLQNMATTNDDGTISYSTGGAQPTKADVPALSGIPVVIVNNWQGQNLKVANISITSAATIQVAAAGPGLGTTPTALAYSTPLTVASGSTAQGTTAPAWQTLQLRSSASTSSVIAIVGGPNTAGNNAYVITLNAPTTTGVPSGNVGTPVANGNYATTTQNLYSFPFNWQASWQIFVANMSAGTANDVTVTLLNN